MKAKNQIVVLSGILVLLATATIAASYTVQPVNAQGNPNPYGQTNKNNAQCGQTNSCDGGAKNWGDAVSSAAQDDSGANTHQGLGDWRANGCKTTQTRGTSNAGLC